MKYVDYKGIYLIKSGEHFYKLIIDIKIIDEYFGNAFEFIGLECEDNGEYIKIPHNNAKCDGYIGNDVKRYVVELPVETGSKAERILTGFYFYYSQFEKNKNNLKIKLEYKLNGENSIITENVIKLSIKNYYADDREKELGQKIDGTLPNNENINIKSNIEMAIIRAIDDKIIEFETRTSDFCKKNGNHREETEITRDLQSGIEQVLKWYYKVNIVREYTMGHSKIKLGEIDMAFRINESDVVAILENKHVDSKETFINQYGQLCGYLNKNVEFGITVSYRINQKDPKNLFEDVENWLEEIKKNQSNYCPTLIEKRNDHCIVSEHDVIEHSGKKMKIYHFIIDFFDAERRQIAIQSRKK